MSTRAVVPHAGGKLTFTPVENGYSLKFSHTSSTHGMALYQVAVSKEYAPLAVVPATGIGRMPPYPQPSILCYIISDAQQMWGRSCPICRCYFRTDHIHDATFCPYCTFEAESLWFLTDSQYRYLRRFVDTAKRVLSERVEVAVDLDAISDAPEWTYDEMQLQHHFQCSTCNVTVDILGEYGSCPKCGKRNSGGVFNRKLNEIESHIAAADRDRRADLLSNGVAALEAMGNDLKKILVSFPTHPTRRRQIARMSFLEPTAIVQQFKDWFGFDLCDGWTPG